MRIFSLMVLSLAVGLSWLLNAQGAEPAKADVSSLKTTKEQASWLLGFQTGRGMLQQFKTSNVDVDTQAIAKGVIDGLNNAGIPYDAKQIDAIMGAFEKDVAAKQKVASDKNKAEGVAFLAENKKKEGVKTTASGLQYSVIKEGSGAKPGPTDVVKAHYRGTLLNGTEFDSSYDRPEPASFRVNKVIPGWTEALQLMKVGSKYKLFVPAELAYGENSPGGAIGPNSLLLFEVELLGVEKPKRENLQLQQP